MNYTMENVQALPWFQELTAAVRDELERRLEGRADLRPALEAELKSVDGQVLGIARYGQFLSGSACRLIADQIIRQGTGLMPQIQGGAPFDLFFSADMDYPKKLEASGSAEPGTLFEYALGQMVIWTPANSQVSVAREKWNALLDERIQKIAIANPSLAPYGRAAVSALQKAGIYEQVKAKLVYGENISQAAQFVQSGNAQAGIIAHSLAVSPGMEGGEVWEIPADMHPPIEQGAVVLKSGKNKAAALEFLKLP